MKLDITKPVQTKDGRQVSIITWTEGTENRPIIGKVKVNGFEEVLMAWDKDGVYFVDPSFNLCNVPEKHKHQKWIDMAKADPTIKWEERDADGVWLDITDPQWKYECEYRPKPKTVRKYLWNMYNESGGVYMTSTYATEEQIKKTLVPIHSQTDIYIDVEEPVND